MKHRRRFLLALWLAIQLLAAQQLALAHPIGHLDEMVQAQAAATSPGANDDDERRGAGHSLTQACTTCVGCLGFNAALAASAVVTCALAATAGEVATATLAAPALRRLPTFHSRAPPSLHD